ncbi:ATP-binding protein [Catenovulum maritimum]|uniref:ATP-binding protein n=1 Tax=Catenovulum maritimum TaxID=1513271 RepID=UPI0006607DF7|nr:ATP-binding protein [Catenovulum maritimum]
MDTGYLLNALNAISSSDNNTDTLICLQSLLSPIAQCDNVIILLEQADKTYVEIASTDAIYHDTIWSQGELFNQAQSQEACVLSQSNFINELISQKTPIQAAIASLIVVGVKLSKQNLVVLLTSSCINKFNLEMIDELNCLYPLIKQCSLNILNRENLTRKVAEKTKALQTSEKRFRAFAESASDWFWETDNSLCFSYVSTNDNQKNKNLYQHFIGKHIAQVASEKELSQLKKWSQFEYLLKCQQQFYDFEFEMLDSKGNTRWIALNGFIKQDEFGCFSGYMGTGKDINYHKKRERDLQVAKELAETANAAKSAFLATMSHEIRTPINVILGNLELLQDSDLKATQLKYINAAQGSAKLLQNLISDTLDLAKIESGKFELESIPVNLNSLLDNLELQFDSQSVVKGIEFQTVYHDLPEIIESDPTRLSQILFNLVGNAIKFTAKGKVTLSLSYQNSRITIKVKDTGIGIPEDKLASIFQPFTQAEIHLNRRFGGTGLGLTICKAIIEMMRGEIKCTSQINQGSEFVVELPIKQLFISKPQVSGQNIQSQIHSHRAYSILLAEDNLSNQLVIKALLEKRNHEVTIAENGQVAVNILKEKSFDIILMDMMMPEVDGLTASKLIRGNWPKDKTPIIALTANASVEDQRNCLNAGMNDFLTKPIDSALLADKINYWVLKAQDAS